MSFWCQACDRSVLGCVCAFGEFSLDEPTKKVLAEVAQRPAGLTKCSHCYRATEGRCSHCTAPVCPICAWTLPQKELKPMELCRSCRDEHLRSESFRGVKSR